MTTPLELASLPLTVLAIVHREIGIWMSYFHGKQQSAICLVPYKQSWMRKRPGTSGKGSKESRQAGHKHSQNPTWNMTGPPATLHRIQMDDQRKVHH